MKKQIKAFLKNNIGEIILIIGTGIFFNNLFDFSYKTTGGSSFGIGGGSIPQLYSEHIVEVAVDGIEGVAYYYTSDNLLWITIGVILIISGVLIVKAKYERKN